ncbi:unnamed protein product, partial [Didymodactylos carnosus]
QSKAYAKSYLDEHGSFEVEISPDTDNILRCRIQSRHHNSVKYRLCIEYDQEDDDNPIVDKFCQCESGSRTIGCCAHVSTILWYLGFARHTEWKPPPHGRKLNEEVTVCR